jgi:curli biogenesis system outer membrane secretion channel CsgG
MMRIERMAAVLLLAGAASACVSPIRDRNGQVPLRVGTAPTPNVSPMVYGTQCVREQLVDQPPRRFAVGEVRDYTGKFSNEASEGGFKITQGGSLMVIGALGQLGDKVQLVERYDTRIAEQEISLARTQLIQDPGANGPVVRPMTAGQYFGSDFYIVGGITEANYSISSGGAEVSVAGIGGGARHYAMNVAADLRLVDSKSLRVVKTVSVQKQFVGHEVKANTFRFFDSTLIDINAGEKSNEPLQLGVRATLEYGVLQLVTAAFGKDFAPCQSRADYGFRAGAQTRAVTAAKSGRPPMVVRSD